MAVVTEEDRRRCPALFVLPLPDEDLGVADVSIRWREGFQACITALLA